MLNHKLFLLQARGEEYKRRHPGSSWPQTQYVLGDEEQLPLEPGTVDGECAQHQLPQPLQQYSSAAVVLVRKHGLW